MGAQFSGRVGDSGPANFVSVARMGTHKAQQRPLRAPRASPMDPQHPRRWQQACSALERSGLNRCPNPPGVPFETLPVQTGSLCPGVPIGILLGITLPVLAGKAGCPEKTLPARRSSGRRVYTFPGKAHLDFHCAKLFWTWTREKRWRPRSPGQRG